MAIIGISGSIGAGKDTLGKVIQFARFAQRYGQTVDDIDRYINDPDTMKRVQSESGWFIKKFADKLKEIASLLLGVPRERFEDQEFKNSTLGTEWDVEEDVLKGIKPFEHVIGSVRKQTTVREFLQKLGTEGLRDGLHTNVWVNALMADYKYQNTIIEDVLNRGLREGDKDWQVGIMPNWIITDVRFPNEAQAIKDKGGSMIRLDRIMNPFPKNDHESETALNDWKFDGKFAVGEGYEGLLLAAKQILQHEALGNK